MDDWSTIAAWRVMPPVWEVVEESEELFVTCTAPAVGIVAWSSVVSLRAGTGELEQRLAIVQANLVIKLLPHVRSPLDFS